MSGRHSEGDPTTDSLAQDPELMRQLFGDMGMRDIQAFQEVRGLAMSGAELDGYPIVCPLCKSMIETSNNFEDPPTDMRDHFAVKHPGKKNPYA